MTVVLVAMLATYRVTLLVTADEITAPPREWLLGRLRPEGQWATLLQCPWCVSWWVGLVVCGTGWAFGDRVWWFVPAWALAASAVTGALATHASP